MLCKKSFSIKEVAKMFQTKVKYLPSRKGERYASALSSMSLNNKVLKNFGKIHLKDYVKNFFNSDMEISEMTHKILSGYNQNEITFVSKNTKKLAFFEKFFQLFS